jgi:hypothetical protein
VPIRSEDHSRDDFGHRGRFIRPLQLYRLSHGQINRRVIDLCGVDELGPDPDLAARRNRREEPHTVLGKTLYVGTVYSLADTKWDVIALGQEA